MSEIIFNSPKSVPSLETHVDSLQTTLASLNQQVIILQEAIQERDQKIVELGSELFDARSAYQTTSGKAKQPDQTLTVVAALIKLYKFVTSPGKA